MQDQVATSRQKVEMPAENLAHSSLDSVALVSLAEHLAGGEPDPWGGRDRLWGQKPAHGSGAAFSARLIGMLIVGVLSKPVSGQRRTSALPHSRDIGARISFERCAHGKTGRIPAGRIVLFSTAPAETKRQENLVAITSAYRYALATHCTAAAQHGCS